MVAACEELGGVDWHCGAGDAPPLGKYAAAMSKARFVSDEVDPHPTDRAKPGPKRSLLTEADGGLLVAVIAAALRA